MVQELIKYIITTLVDHPQDVIINARQSDGKTILEIHVSSFDRAKVIGKEGRTLKAIRALAAAVNPSGELDIVLEQEQAATH